MICRYFTKTKLHKSKLGKPIYIDYYGFPYKNLKDFSTEFLSTYKVIYLDWFTDEDLSND